MTKPTRQQFSRLFSFLFLLLCLPAQALAQQESSTEELAQKTQNPVADLISVPLQSNFNFGAGFNHNKTIYVLNVQPVIPINLNEDWNLITRIIMPIINQPSLFPTFNGRIHSTTGTGFGDFNPTFFLSPAKPGELIWGLGPTFTLPTATDRDLGAGKWSMGPAGVALVMHGHWVYGALLNNQWSVGGWGEKNVNAMLLQPFINYNLPDGWYLTSGPILTADWKADRTRDIWTVPVGGGVGKLFRLGQILPLEGHPIAKLPINTQLAFYGNAIKPEFGPEWQLRFQIQFLFPK
ncbi:MAG TPA: neuromedin U [Candidatus Binatia bacterium]|nr:neuromedin U [Candidatus Binatia bacterium]